MTVIPENGMYPPCPAIGYFPGEYYQRPSYDGLVGYAADCVANAVKNAPKGSTITVEKHKDGSLYGPPVVTITVKTEIEA